MQHLALTSGSYETAGDQVPKTAPLSLFLMMLAVSVYAKTTKEHPLIRPYPGSVLAENMTNYSKFNAYEFYYLNEATKKREKKTIKGEYWRLLYEVRSPSGDRVQTISKLEFFENYRVPKKRAAGSFTKMWVKWFSQYLGTTAESRGSESPATPDWGNRI